MRIKPNQNSVVYKKIRNIVRWYTFNKINKSYYHTDEHIVVIESDDWGSIRVPSKETMEQLSTSGDSPIQDPFLKVDCLESSEDLHALCKMLLNVVDKDGRPAVITANFAMANADFEKIKSTKQYHREIFTDTYQRYYGDNTILEDIKKYLDSQVFVPQLHCLEHLNVNQWMRDLEIQKKDTVMALDNHMYGVSATFSPYNPFGYMDAFNYSYAEERADLAERLMLASEWFEEIFGQKSESFVASCHVWDDYLEQALSDLGIYHIQSRHVQVLPSYYSKKNNKRRKKYRRMAEQKENGIFYTIRNCEFEPSIYGSIERAQTRCMLQVENAFHNRVPAIISSHRLNYVGGIDRVNRDCNLAALEQLLRDILAKYPDVVFMSSDALGRKMFGNCHE